MSPARAAADALWRFAYRVGFRAARLWWRLRRPAHDGAVVAVWRGGRVLAVRQSHRSNLSSPGGGIRRSEEPREAARREMREELGLVVSPGDLVFAREMAVDWDFRLDHVRIFELRLRAEPDRQPRDRRSAIRGAANGAGRRQPAAVHPRLSGRRVPGPPRPAARTGMGA